MAAKKPARGTTKLQESKAPAAKGAKKPNRKAGKKS